jgi:hypothetical protein
MEDVEIQILKGKTLTEITSSDDEIIFTTNEGEVFKMYHSQDCCESVSIEDINGDLQDLIGYPILAASEDTNSDEPRGEYDESFTCTFYRISNIKTTVVIRWYGHSNGYYSERVDFEQIA